MENDSVLTHAPEDAGRVMCVLMLFPPLVLLYLLLELKTGGVLRCCVVAFMGRYTQTEVRPTRHMEWEFQVFVGPAA